MKTISFCLLLFVLAFIITACAPQPQVVVPTHYGRLFHEKSVDLSNYRSVQQRKALQDPDIALAVAVSGGGHRAGNFAAGVMLGLESLEMTPKQRGNVLSQVDYFSTVSGGGFAVAAYLSSMKDHRFFSTQIQKTNHANTDTQVKDRYSFAGAIGADLDSQRCTCRSRNNGNQEFKELTDPCLRRHLERSYHGDILEALSLGNIFGKADRGDYLERAIADNVLGMCWRKNKLHKMNLDEEQDHAELKLGDIFIPKDSDREVRLPYWVANATVFGNGAIFPFTPDHLLLYGVNGYTHRLTDVVAKEDEDPNDFIANMPMSVALRASANFPGVIPTTAIPCKVHGDQLYLHLLDGGLGDNLGAITAMNLLKQDNAKRKVLIVIDAFEAVTEPHSAFAESPGIGRIIARTLMITLDSTRARVYARLRDAGDGKHPRIDGVEVIYISFEAMLCEPGYEQQVYNRLIEYDNQYNRGRLEEELKRELRAFDENGNVLISPYALARSVITQYNISVAQQDMLFAAGRYIVDQKRSQIFNSMDNGTGK